MTTLVTFIGRCISDADGPGYRKTTYRMPDGSLSEPVTYVGKVLTKKLDPTRVVIVGTSGSMWDEICFDNLDEDFHIHLLDRCSKQTVDENLLAELESKINQDSCIPYALVLVPDGASEQEQVEFFAKFTSSIYDKESIVLDVTHGFRFMPILAFSSIQFLQFIKQVTVTNLLYAMYIPGQDISSIFSLQQSIELGAWINALSQYDHSGDLGVFADLLTRQDWPQNKVNQLKKGAFLERTTNSNTAKSALTDVLNEPWGTTIGEMLSSEFAKRTEWVRKEDRSSRECMLAKQYLERNDYIRAVIYGFEGVISRHAKSNDYLEREQTKSKLVQQYGDDFKLLRTLRNNLVHGVHTKPNSNMSRGNLALYEKANRSITDSEELPILLRSIFKSLKIASN